MLRRHTPIEIEKIKNYRLREDLKEEYLKSLSFPESDLHVDLERLEEVYAISSIEKELDLKIIKATYDLTPSSYQGFTDFGVVGISNSPSELHTACSAQMNGFSLEADTGKLIGKDSRGNIITLASPSYPLPKANTLDELHGEFIEYKLSEELELVKANYKLKKKTKIYWDRSDFRFSTLKNDVKQMNLVFKNKNTDKTHRFHSFR